MKPKLKLVADEPKDITTLLRADIEKRDWSRVHIEADKRKPLPGWWAFR